MPRNEIPVVFIITSNDLDFIFVKRYDLHALPQEGTKIYFPDGIGWRTVLSVAFNLEAPYFTEIEININCSIIEKEYETYRNLGWRQIKNE